MLYATTNHAKRASGLNLLLKMFILVASGLSTLFLFLCSDLSTEVGVTVRARFDTDISVPNAALWRLKFFRLSVPYRQYSYSTEKIMMEAG